VPVFQTGRRGFESRTRDHSSVSLRLAGRATGFGPVRPGSNPGGRSSFEIQFPGVAERFPPKLLDFGDKEALQQKTLTVEGRDHNPQVVRSIRTTGTTFLSV
jgi:hypothetical protein